MIIRAHRFHGYNALRSVYSHSQTVRGPWLMIRYIHNSRRSSYRAAVVVSRKVHKSAVVRGRIRRRIYEIIRGQEAIMLRPYDMIITVFSDQLATMPAAELSELVVSLLVRIGFSTQADVSRPSGTHVIVDAKERSA